MVVKLTTGLAALVAVAALLMVVSSDSTSGLSVNDLLTNKALAQSTSMNVVFAEVEVDQAGSPVTETEDTAPGVDEKEFHEDYTSVRFKAFHLKTGSNKTKYKRADGRKYEHISKSEYAPHASKYKPDGTQHIKKGQWASYYDKPGNQPAPAPLP